MAISIVSSIVGSVVEPLVSSIMGPATAGGGGGGGDPFFSSVKLLLGFEGTDGATSTTDESGAPHTITFNGDAQIDTAQFKFGASSCLFDGTGDYLSTPDSADWDLSDANSDQFTIEFWMRPHTGGATFRYPLGQAPANGNIAWYFEFSSQRISFNCSATAGGAITTIAFGGGPQMSLDNWHAICVDKDSAGKIRLYVDGVVYASATPADSAIFNSTGALEIGRSWATAAYDGWLDEIRITKGVARYASDAGYTVPTAAFPRS